MSEGISTSDDLKNTLRREGEERERQHLAQKEARRVADQERERQYLAEKAVTQTRRERDLNLPGKVNPSSYPEKYPLAPRFEPGEKSLSDKKPHVEFNPTGLRPFFGPGGELLAPHQQGKEPLGPKDRSQQPPLTEKDRITPKKP